jgi:hypothetical protein
VLATGFVAEHACAGGTVAPLDRRVDVAECVINRRGELLAVKA